MSRHRRLPSLGRHVRRALTRAVTVTAVAGLVVVGGAGVARVSGGADGPHSGYEVVGLPPESEANRLIERYDCSTVGYDDGSTPQSAIVRGANGRIRVVTFEKGWTVHTAGGPAQLVAVCLRPAP